MVLLPIAETSSRANKTDSWRTQKPVINYETCIRCMICWKFCPDNAINYLEKSDLPSPSTRIAALEVPVIDYDYCKGCGICANECPEKSIEMIMEGSE